MIRRSLPDGDLLITQTEHALQAARLAAHLRDLPEPRDALIRAVSLHDSGWPMFDDEPRPLADGKPPHIFDHDTGFSAPAWRRSVAVARASGPLEALLVSLHFSRFSARFAGEQADLQAAWRLHVPRETEEAGVRLLRYCDSLSLRLLCDPKERVNLPQDVTYEDGWLSPWPFAIDSIEDTVTGKRLPRRKWETPGELAAAYGAAPQVQWTVKLLPI
jgi:hypothetical protein